MITRIAQNKLNDRSDQWSYMEHDYRLLKFCILAIAAIVAIAEFIFEQWRDDRT